MAGITEMNQRTCLLFTPREAHHVDYVRIIVSGIKQFSIPV
jgi:hypothetical protein